MTLGDAEMELLEDCQEDWRGLWELAWKIPHSPIQDCIALLVPLVQAGYLTILQLSDWSEARTAASMAPNDALAIALTPGSYAASRTDDGKFYALSITDKGEAAIEAKHGPRLQTI